MTLKPISVGTKLQNMPPDFFFAILSPPFLLTMLCKVLLHALLNIPVLEKIIMKIIQIWSTYGVKT